MSRNSLLVLVAVIALALLVGQAEATTISGSAETCPGGDPLVDFPVRVYVEQTFVYTAYTDYNGWYSVDVTWWGLVYGNLITVSLGPAEFPYKGGSCPKQASAFYTGSNIVFPDLKFECGVPRKPPCPQQ